MSIHEKLSHIQATLKAPKGQWNDFGKYKYRNCEDILEAVKPLLNGLILTVSDDVVAVGDRIYVKATATVSDGEHSVSVTGYARAALKVRQHLLADVADIDAEIDRLQKLKSAPEKNAERIKEYVAHNMEEAGQDKMDLGVFRVTLKKPAKQLGMIDETKVPDDYWTVIPESKKIDRRKLLSDAKQGDFDFVELVDGKRSLLIK